MVDENEAETLDNEQQAAADDGQARQRSKIAFPYTDLRAALAVAGAIHEQVGHGDCTSSQLAAWLSVSPKSSGFRLQLTAARMFGVLDSDGPDQLRLSTLGRRVVDPNQARGAKAEAFLEVPLFHAIYNNHKDGVLPPTAALEREIASLGVAEKQKDRARQVFERSAEQAGFFEHGRDRLVLPAVAKRDAKSGEQEKDRKGGGGNGDGSGGDRPSLHPFIEGLLRELPKAGQSWPEDKRKLWLSTAESIFKMIYKDEPVSKKTDEDF